MRDLGDRALLVDSGDPQGLARRLQAEDVIAGATTVGVVGRPSVAARSTVEAPRLHEIPVSFDGEDLQELGLSAEVLRAELSGELEVAFLGFMPGFAYLRGLPDVLAAIPRLRTPRERVPAGSFAVAGGHAAIYPSPSPGGWRILGHSDVRLFDHANPPYSLLRPGDRVRIVPVTDLPLRAPKQRPLIGGNGIEVIDPGVLCLIEDMGRRGCGSLGVPRAGATNYFALRVCNLAVGNDEGAAALEIAGTVQLRALRDLLVAGDAALAVDGTALPAGLVAAVGSGQVLSATGFHSIVAFAGGITTNRLFDSRSTDAVTSLPPGRLVKGDRLPLGDGGRARLRYSFPEGGLLRVMAGPDEVGSGPLNDLITTRWEVDVRSDRSGTRLAGPEMSAPPGVPSHAVVPGAVQLLPGGTPVVLGPDCGPVGGYAVAATVISADLWRLGLLRPGGEVSFELVSRREARDACREVEAGVARSVTGWFPTRFA